MTTDLNPLDLLQTSVKPNSVVRVNRRIVRSEPPAELLSLLDQSTRLIPICDGTFALVDSTDFEELSKYAWHAGSGGYPKRTQKRGLNPRAVRMSRQIMKAPDGVQVDHISGNVRDNRRCNLRLASSSENCRNTKPHRDNKSGLKGVCFSIQAQKWHAKICLYGKQIHLGYHATPELAHLAYCEAAARLHGQFARTS